MNTGLCFLSTKHAVVFTTSLNTISYTNARVITHSMLRQLNSGSNYEAEIVYWHEIS